MQSSCSNIYIFWLGTVIIILNLIFGHIVLTHLKLVRYDNEYIDGLLSLSASIFKGVYISSDQI